MSPREMESEAKREGTFSNHPWPHSGTPLTPGRLAAAGFYAAPTPKARDRVVCFACDNALTHWDTTDDPMKEHSTWYPQCPFVQGKPTGNIPRRRNIVPKLPTTPTTESITCAEFPSASQSADGEIEGRAGVGSRDRANGGENNYGLIAGPSATNILTAARSGLGSYIQSLQLQGHGGTEVGAPLRRPTSPRTPPAEVSIDIVYKGPGKSKKASDAQHAHAVSPASHVLAMWEDKTGVEDSRKAPDVHVQLPAQQPPQHIRDATFVETNGAHTATGPDACNDEWEPANAVYEEAQICGRHSGAPDTPGRPKGKKKKDKDKEKERDSKQQDEWIKECEEQRAKREEWKVEEERALSRIADLHEQEHSASTASERLLHMDSLVREVLQGIRKGHEQMVDRTCGRLEALQGRVGVAGGRIDAAKGHVEGLRDNVEILRAEKDRLRKEVEGYKASLDRIAGMDAEVAAAERRLGEGEQERERLQHSLLDLRAEMSRMLESKAMLSIELQDSEDMLSRRKHVLEAHESRLQGLDERQALLNASEAELKEREQGIIERETRSRAREEWAVRKEGELKGLEAVLLARDKKLREREETSERESVGMRSMTGSPASGRRRQELEAIHSPSVPQSPRRDSGGAHRDVLGVAALRAVGLARGGKPAYQHLNAW